MRIWAIRASIPIIPRLGDVAVLAGLVTAGEQQKVKVSTDQDREAASSQYTKHPENVSFFSHKDCLLKMATLTYILHMDKNINQTSTNMTRGGREEMDDAFTHTI